MKKPGHSRAFIAAGISRSQPHSRFAPSFPHCLSYPVARVVVTGITVRHVHRIQADIPNGELSTVTLLSFRNLDMSRYLQIAFGSPVYPVQIGRIQIKILSQLCRGGRLIKTPILDCLFIGKEADGHEPFLSVRFL